MIPTYFDQVDAAWLSEALSQRGPATNVTRVERLDTRKGAGAKMFLRVSYRDPGGLPETLVVKGCFVEREPDEFALTWEGLTRRLNAAEARFYRDFAAQVDIEIPACHFADIDADSGRSAVILENLAVDGARFGAYDEPLGRDAVAAVLANLAALHSQFWADPALDGPLLKDPLVEDSAEGAGMLHYFISEDNWNDQMSRPRAERIPPSLRDRTPMVEAITTMWARQFDAPLTTLHGDPHIGNLFFRPDGRPGLLDWQVFCRGIWATDVAYFMAGAMDSADRLAHERDLLRHYLEVLAAGGGPVVAFDEAWTRYRERMFHGFMNILTPPGASQTEDYDATMGERFSTAILELDSFGALGLTAPR